MAPLSGIKFSSKKANCYFILILLILINCWFGISNKNTNIISKSKIQIGSSSQISTKSQSVQEKENEKKNILNNQITNSNGLNYNYKNDKATSITSNTNISETNSNEMNNNKNFLKQNNFNLSTISNPINTNDTKLLEKPQKIYDNNDEARISKTQISVFIDPIDLGCDLKFLEKSSFVFNPPTNIIYYTVISPRNSYYNFKVNISNTIMDIGLKIVDVQVYVDKSFREKTFVDQYNNNLSFRDRWVIVVTLNKPVHEIELDFNYLSERSILIKQEENTNLVKLTFFNPYNQKIPYDIGISFTGFMYLTASKLKLPWDSKIREFTYKKNNKVYDNGLEITSSRELDSFAQYELFLSLPLELKTCDTGFIKVVYYSLIAVTIVFGLASLFTIYTVYKE
jgi:hypothetical protein